MRSYVVPFLVLLPKALSLGCASNSNEIVRYSPELRGPDLAVVGSEVPLSLKVNQGGHSLSDDAIGNGYCDNRYIVSSPTLTLESANCEGDGCSLQRRNDDLVVTKAGAGTVTVKVEALASDGRRYSLTHTISFAQPTELSVTRDPLRYPAGAWVASVANRSQVWRVVPQIGGRPAFASSFGARAEGALSVTTTSALSKFELAIASDRPGEGSVVVSVGGLERSFPLHVIDPNAITHAELLPGPTYPTTVDEVDVTLAASAYESVTSRLLVPYCTDSAARKASGRYVALKVVDAEGVVGFADLEDRYVADAEHILQVGANQLIPIRGGAGVLTGAIGKAQLATPFLAYDDCDADRDASLDLPSALDAGADAIGDVPDAGDAGD